MTFSIIVVSLNAGEELSKTVDSILQQDCTDYEIIVKDGGSTDKSVEQLKKNEHIHIIIQKDTSIYDAMNQATKVASGEYFIFLNCGDYFYSNTVLTEISAAMKQKKADIYYGDLYRRIQGCIDYSSKSITDFVCYRNVPCHQVCIYYKDLFEKRGYDSAYPVRADYEHFLWCRYCDGAECSYLPVVISSYEGNGFSETKENLRKAEKEHREITKKYLGGKCFWYRFVMIVTLQPLRKCIAGSKHLSGVYQKLKKMCYR